jgi:uncharacterized membrane protein YuzA (DUF378 family)
MKKMNGLDWVAFVLVIIGALNWGLVGFFKYDLVKAIFGDMTTMSRIIYDLVGISALYLIIAGFAKKSA